MKAASILAAIALALGAGQALADDEQDSAMVRIGVGWAAPEDDANWLRLDGIRLVGMRAYMVDGRSATFTGRWLFADRWTVGLLTPLPLDREMSGLPAPINGPVQGPIDLGIGIALGRDRQWLFNAAVWYLDIDSNAAIRFPVNGGSSRRGTGLDRDPFVYSVGIGYRF